MEQDLRRILEQITAAEREAAELILHAHHILSEQKSGRRDVVTEYDRRVQALLIRRLGEAVPEARFFCEDNEQRDDLQAEALFVIDPIDGTMNFVRGMHHSCISVAFFRKGQPLIGAIYNPYARELFTAIRGQGAFLNGRPIQADPHPLAENIVCCGSSPYRSDLSARTFRIMEAAFNASLDIRREASAALDLCSVAAGRAGAYFELSLSLWDYAAGALIAREAGARVSTAEGTPLPLDGSKPSVLAAGPRAYEDFRALLEALPPENESR